MGQFSQLNLWGQDAKPAAKAMKVTNPEGEWSPSPRQVNRDKVWDTWRSRGGRSTYPPPSEEINSRSTLPETGTWVRHRDDSWLDERIPFTGWGSSRPYEPPTHVDYHESTHTSWRKHTTAEYVPLTQPVYSHQEDVSLDRVHQLMNDREGTSDSRSARGLRRELPRMFKDSKSQYHIIDGNHRVTSDVLSGRLFTEAYVAHPHNLPSFQATNSKIHEKKVAAREKHGYEPTRRMYNLYEGKTPDGEWYL